MNLSTLIDELMRVERFTFSRIPSYQRETNSLSCDCAGLITLLLNEMSIQTPLKNRRAVDYFNYIETLEHKTSISTFRRGDIVAWKKEVPPQNGDTGHLLILKTHPKLIEHTNDYSTYSCWVWEVNRFSDSGIQERQITFFTSKDSIVWGVQWAPNNPKVKKTSIIAYSLFKATKCQECFSPLADCLCNFWSKEDLIEDISLTILQDPREEKHPLNTVKLLTKCFSQTTILKGIKFNQDDIPEGTVLLYPSEEKEESTHQELSSSHLVVIDATWKGSFRILQENPWLKELPRISLEHYESQYFLRREPSNTSLSTFESIALAYRQKNKEGALQLLQSFNEFIEKKKSQVPVSILEEFYKDR